MSRCVRRVVWILGAVLLAGSTSSAETIRLEQPTAAALRAALERVELLRKEGDDQPATILLPAGQYAFDQTLELSSAVVGEGLTLRAEQLQQVVFTGGRKLSGAQRTAEGQWRFPLPSGWNQFGAPRVLVVDGELRSAARHPNEGYLRIDRALEDRRSGFTVRPGDLPNDFAATADRADLVLLHDWSSSRLPVASYQVSTRELRSVSPIGCSAPHYAIDHFEAQPRYWLEGHPTFADAAGEWYLDRAAGAVVIVADGSSSDAAPEVVLPWIETVVRAAGDDERPVQQLILAGIHFTGTRFPMPPGGLAAAQATMHEPRAADGSRSTGHRPMLAAAVHLERAEQCRVVDCSFTALGGTGLWIGGRTRGCHVKRSRFDDIGGNAINLGEDHSRRVAGDVWYQSAPDQVPTGNQVTGCTITRCGQILPGAVAIWAALQRDLEIAGNTIQNCPYTGISLGWIWSEAESPAGNNHIHDNRIESVLQVLSDGGGIYTLGRQPGSVLERNQISDVPTNAGRAESNGMFLDEGTTGFTIRENTIRGVAKSPLRFHRAGTNLVRDNAWELATPETPPVRFNSTPEANVTMESNRVLQD